MGNVMEIINQMEVNMQCSLKEDEYIGEDGIIYCKNCNTKRRTDFLVFGKYMPVMCKCKEEEYNKEQERNNQLEKQRIVDKLKRTSLLGDKYKDATFENTDTLHNEDFKKIYTRCKNYCIASSKVLENGIGIYLFGNKGTGKSRITACMANELMNKYYTVLYTNFSEISKQIRETFNKSGESESDFLERLNSIDFLFIDDFGTEIVTKNGQDIWLQEKVFEVINKRYNNNKPIIFTSNYSLEQLIKERGIADKTVDRIMEICEIMKLDGMSYRRNIMMKREKLF